MVHMTTAYSNVSKFPKIHCNNITSFIGRSHLAVWTVWLLHIPRRNDCIMVLVSRGRIVLIFLNNGDHWPPSTDWAYDLLSGVWTSWTLELLDIHCLESIFGMYWQ